MTATGADITGTITATSGSIGDWEINNDGDLTNGNLVLNGNGLYVSSSQDGDWGIYFQNPTYGGELSIGNMITVESTGGNEHSVVAIGPNGGNLDLSMLDEIYFGPNNNISGLNLTAVFG